MKKNLIIFLSFIGLLGFLSSCEKDETKVVMLASPIAPTIQTMPDLTLQRAHGLDTLLFICTAVNPGFQASANYFLEACATGNKFVDAFIVISDIRADTLRITVGDLNGIFLKKFPAELTASIDFRLTSMLVVDAGAPDSMVYISEIKTADVTPYALPSLNLIGSGFDQKIESALGDGKYVGFIKFDPAMPFTLVDLFTNTEYGDNAGALAINGAGISAGVGGWYKLSVNTNELTYASESYMIGLVGTATPNAWDSPDQKMDFDLQTGTWNITIDLIVGEYKFRLNDGWAWNLGGTANSLIHNGPNCVLTEAGNYTVSLTITNPTPGVEAGTYKIVKN